MRYNNKIKLSKNKEVITIRIMKSKINHMGYMYLLVSSYNKKRRYICNYSNKMSVMFSRLYSRGFKDKI